jgi:hypothetical protein
MAGSRNRKSLTDTERDERRKADRERIEHAARALLSSDGWQRWIRVRANNGLSRYSIGNQMLIAIEWHARGIPPTYVAGFRAVPRSQPLRPQAREGHPHPRSGRDQAPRRARRGERREEGLLPNRPGLRRLDD